MDHDWSGGKKNSFHCFVLFCAYSRDFGQRFKLAARTLLTCASFDGHDFA